MIVGIGVDLMQNGRVERELSLGGWTPSGGVYTAQEIENYGDGSRKSQRFSASFAVKEAVMKALGAEVEDLAMFREVEVLYVPSGMPSIHLHARVQSKAQSLGVRRVWISTASGKKHAGALVVLES